MYARYRSLHRMRGCGIETLPLPKRLAFLLLADRFESQARKLYGACIPVECSIGDAIFPHYWYGVHIGARTKIGDRVTIFQHVTVGSDARGICPVIEDGVTLGAGATIIGRTTIGEGSHIGANVTLTDVVIPPGSVIVNKSAFDIGRGVPVYPGYKAEAHHG